MNNTKNSNLIKKDNSNPEESASETSSLDAKEIIKGENLGEPKSSEYIKNFSSCESKESYMTPKSIPNLNLLYENPQQSNGRKKITTNLYY
jgi:hypothetical protein